MQLELAQFIVDLAHDIGHDIDEVHVYENYSGRGMCGNTTAGVVGISGSEIARMILSYAQDSCMTEELSSFTIPHSFKEDSLGLSTIIY